MFIKSACAHGQTKNKFKKISCLAFNKIVEAVAEALAEATAEATADDARKDVEVNKAEGIWTSSLQMTTSNAFKRFVRLTA